MVFSEVAGTLSFLQPQCDDDMTDRLHYYYSPSALLVTAVLISLKMFGGSPVECWLPAEFQTSWQEYTELMCWSQNTYFVKFENDFPRDEKAREQTMISYYQWTPFFLVLSAFFFYSPCLIWRIFYSKSGIVLKEVVAFATDPSNIQQRVRDANLRGISAHLSAAFRHQYFKYNRLRVQHNDSLMTRLFNLRFYEAYLTSLYIIVKLLFLANVMAQAYLMNRFLQTDYYDYYGWGVFKDLLQGKAWNDSGNFPRITYCDLDVRILGTVQKHTVQCVLVINIFTEKIFVMLWIWYTLLMAISIFSLLNWIFRMVPVDARRE
ncbi:innexin domain-containing protein [Ditylenchus destructor]|uniref:Innexin n=1 Tax=Ditylenchus destructor TaxID=166010 RepID=A0AAD4RC51_9BILA|nr:innexin domain-containing protein [Ditylenchus destructor]